MLVAGFQEGGLELTFLIWDTVRQLQEVDVSKRNTNILRLPSCKAAREMRVPKEATILEQSALSTALTLGLKRTDDSRSLRPIHRGRQRIFIRLLTLATLLLLARPAFATCDLEAGHHTLTRLDIFNLRADRLDDAAKLMA